MCLATQSKHTKFPCVICKSSPELCNFNYFNLKNATTIRMCIFFFILYYYLFSFHDPLHFCCCDVCCCICCVFCFFFRHAWRFSENIFGLVRMCYVVLRVCKVFVCVSNVLLGFVEK